MRRSLLVNVEKYIPPKISLPHTKNGVKPVYVNKYYQVFLTGYGEEFNQPASIFSGKSVF